MSHLSQEVLLEFVAGRLTTEAAERAYAHLGACEVCAQRCQAIQSIRTDFEGSWDEFLDEIRARCSGWAPEKAPADELLKATEVLLRGTLDGAHRLATAALARLSDVVRGEGSLEVSFCPAYSGVGDPSEAGEAARLAEEASGLCGAGRDREALRILEKASRLDRRTGECATLDLLFERNKIGEVVVDAGRRSVSVLIQPKGPGGASGVVVLKPESSAAPEQRAELEPVEGAYYSLAEFENIPDGSFSLLVRLKES